MMPLAAVDRDGTWPGEPPASSAAAPIVPPDLFAAALADAAPAPAPGAAPPAIVDYDAEAKDLIEFTWACFAPIYPSLTPIYTGEVRARIAGAAAPLLRKYNLTLGAFGPELVFVVTIFPLVVPTYQAIKHDRKAEADEIARAGAAHSTPAGAAAAPGAAGTDPLARFPGAHDGAGGASAIAGA